MFGGSDNDSKNVTFLPSLTIFPGVRFAQTKGFAVVAGFPISAGISYDDDGNDFYAGVDLPVTVNLCFGSAFNDRATHKFGFFLGGGVGYHVSHNESFTWDGIVEKNHLRVLGTLVQTGFTVAYDKQKAEGIAIRLSWLADSYLNKNVFGIGVIAFGKFKD